MDAYQLYLTAAAVQCRPDPAAGEPDSDILAECALMIDADIHDRPRGTPTRKDRLIGILVHELSKLSTDDLHDCVRRTLFDRPVNEVHEDERARVRPEMPRSEPGVGQSNILQFPGR
jgi:hypothetical protein